MTGAVHGWAPQLQAIVNEAAQLTGETADTIIGHSRIAPLTRARFAVIWAARRATDYSYPQISRALRRDHTSIVYGYHAAERLRGGNADFRALCDVLHVHAVERREAALAEIRQQVA